MCQSKQPVIVIMIARRRFCAFTSLLIDGFLQLVTRRPQPQCILGVRVGVFMVASGWDYSLEAPPYIDPPVIDRSGLSRVIKS